MTDETFLPPAPPKASLAEDFVDIFFSPREVFARRATSGYALVMIILTLLIGGLFLANRGMMDEVMKAEMTRAMADAMKQNPQMTQQQAEAGMKIGTTIATFGAFVGVPIALFLIGFGVWLTARALGATVTYQAATMIATYSYLPRILEALSISVQGLFLDTSAMHGRYQLSFGVGRFLDPDMSRGLLALVGRIDLFTLWVTALIAIGLAVVAKLPREKAFAAGAIMWAFGALPAVWTLIRG
ncbi:MAG: YIP1 family protein [Gemmatimonadaceae bacterium]|nr:YIP1 family protein [Gemmatimonadaceae bacterium]